MKNKKENKVSFMKQDHNNLYDKQSKTDEHKNISYSVYVDEMIGMEDYRRK